MLPFIILVISVIITAAAAVPSKVCVSLRFLWQRKRTKWVLKERGGVDGVFVTVFLVGNVVVRQLIPILFPILYQFSIPSQFPP